MTIYEKILNREEKIALVGLGYVGMPIAVAFAKKVNVIGYDLNAKKSNYTNKELIQLKKLGMKGLRKQQLNLLRMRKKFQRQNLSLLQYLHL